MNKIFLFVFFSIPCILKSQITFEKEIGGTNSESGFCVRPTSGGYIISGSTTSFGSGTGAAYLIRTNLTGDTLWTRTFGNGNGATAVAVRQTTDGGFIVAGNSNFSLYLLKLDSNGNIMWQKAFAGCYATGVSNSIEQTSDDGYIFAGTTHTFGAGNEDIYLLKTDSGGNLLWTRTFGGTDYDQGESVKQTYDGGYIVCGYTGSFGFFSGSTYLIKTNAVGDTLWTRTIGYNSAVKCYDIHQTNDSGYVVSGYTGVMSNNNSYDFLLVKIDLNGNLLWSKAYGGILNDWSYSLSQNSDGGFSLTGFAQSFNVSGNIGHAYIVRTNPNGDTLWTRLIGDDVNDQTPNSIYQASDHGYIIAGNISGSGKLYLVKTDSSGNLGCDVKSTATIVTTPVLFISRPPTQVSSGSSIGTVNFQIGHGGTESISCLTLNNNDSKINEARISLYPNPASGKFRLQCYNSLSVSDIFITNIFGEIVYSKKCNQQLTSEIDLSDQPNGIYFVNVKSEKESFTTKIIVQK